MIPQIRLASQQLVNPAFNSPEELITWMGAMQAQEYTMAKWAIGIRLKNSTLTQVESAINSGQLIRTHVMRPTWHLVPGKDLRWMLELSAKRNLSAFESYGKYLEVPPSFYNRFDSLIGKMLEGNNHLTKQEIVQGFNQEGYEVNTNHVSWLLGIAEVQSVVCSGIDKKEKPTYALVDERVPQNNSLTREEALALLATRYFQSHSPATMEDFIWWSGLTATEAKQATKLIEKDLFKENLNSNTFYIHESYKDQTGKHKVFHFLPSYDEYLISYKDRTHVLPKHHYPKAFNNYGIFYPVTLLNGEIVGNWKKSTNKKDSTLDSTWFESEPACKRIKEIALKRYKSFYGK